MRGIPLLDEELAPLLRRGVSIKVASGDDDHPLPCRALGCRIGADRRNVVLLFSAECSPSLFSKLREPGPISVVLHSPSLHKNIQIKGRDVRFAAVQSNDHALIDTYRKAFHSEVVAMGHREHIARSLVPDRPSDVVAISLTPTAIIRHETAAQFPIGERVTSFQRRVIRKAY